MTYPYLIPGSQSDLALFTANSTLILGTFDKPLDARSDLLIEYSVLTPSVTLVGYSFRVAPGGEPQLLITDIAIDSTSTALSFTVSGGIGGRAYEVTINTTLASGEIRSDVLTVNVLGDDCGCAPMPAPPPVDGVVSGDGSVFYNTTPRYFVSATPPVGPKVLDRWYNTTTGVISDYATNGRTSTWVASTSGGVGGFTFLVRKMLPISPDGTTRVFTLAALDLQPVSVADQNKLLVSQDGVWQEAGVEYTALGNAITFSVAPTTDSYIFILLMATQ